MHWLEGEVQAMGQAFCSDSFSGESPGTLGVSFRQITARINKMTGVENCTFLRELRLRARGGNGLILCRSLFLLSFLFSIFDPEKKGNH